MNLFFWFLLLIVQNAAFTLVSRARNSSSIVYHALAAVASNGVWFASQFIMVGMMVHPGLTPGRIAALACTYIAGTVVGSVLMHAFAMKVLEAGNLKRIWASFGDFLVAFAPMATFIIAPLILIICLVVCGFIFGNLRAILAVLFI